MVRGAGERVALAKRRARRSLWLFRRARPSRTAATTSSRVLSRFGIRRGRRRWADPRAWFYRFLLLDDLDTVLLFSRVGPRSEVDVKNVNSVIFTDRVFQMVCSVLASFRLHSGVHDRVGKNGCPSGRVRQTRRQIVRFVLWQIGKPRWLDKCNG